MVKRNFNDPEEFSTMEREAYDGQLDFNEFPAAEYRYFDRIQDIGCRSRHEGLPRELARKGAIIDRIRLCDMLMSQGRFFILRRCKRTIAALSEAVWDSKSPTRDKRLDDGTTNIDSLDALEYALESHANQLIQFGGRYERK